MDRSRKIELLKGLASGRIKISDLNKKPQNFRFELIEDGSDEPDRPGELYKDLISGVTMSLAEINEIDIGNDPNITTRINIVRAGGGVSDILISTDGRFLRD